MNLLNSGEFLNLFGAYFFICTIIVDGLYYLDMPENP